jgi:hypothetical protein
MPSIAQDHEVKNTRKPPNVFHDDAVENAC